MLVPEWVAPLVLAIVSVAAILRKHLLLSPSSILPSISQSTNLPRVQALVAAVLAGQTSMRHLQHSSQSKIRLQLHSRVRLISHITAALESDTAYMPLPTKHPI